MNNSSILGKSSVFLQQSFLSSESKYLIPLIRQSNFDLVHKGLSQKQMFYQDDKSRNLLYYACYYNKQDIFLYLINRGLPINQLDSEGRNLWHVCAYTGSLYCFGILLSHNECLRRMIAGKNLKACLDKYKFKKSDYKNGELVISTTQDRIYQFKKLKESVKEIVQNYFNAKLEEYKQGLSAQDSVELRTPIHLGSLNKSQRSLQIIEIMLRETFPEYKDYLQLGERISSTIQNYQDPRIYNSIISDLMNAIGIPVFQKIQNSQKLLFNKFIKSIINLKDKGGFSSLHLSSYGGSSSISAILKKMGAQISDPESTEKQNVVEIAKNNSVRNTIMDLCEASQLGDNSTINLLINCGQDINTKKTIFGITPLYNSMMYCSKTNRIDSAKILLENGADIDAQDVNGWTSLHKACQIGNIEMVELLISKNANPKKTSNKGWIPLHIAAINDHYEIIDLLHSKIKDTNLDAKDHQGSTALIMASKHGSNKAICKLLELGANLYAFDNKKMTSLHYATFKQQLQTIRTLLYYDADFDKLRGMKNCHQKPAKQLSNDSITRSKFDNVWSASREGKLDILRRLVLEGANKDQQTYHLKRTPLMYAIMGGHVLVVKYLLESGASTYPQDSMEQSATHYVSLYIKTGAKNQKSKRQITGKQINLLMQQFES